MYPRLPDRWAPPPFAAPSPRGWVAYARPRAQVGALSAGGLAELGKQGIIVSDQVVRDLDIPIMQTALDLMDVTFKIADDIGVGTEVRSAVYAIRGAQYAGTTVGSILGVAAGSGVNAAGASAASAVLTGIGGVAALGTVFVVATVLSDLFGSSGNEEAAVAARKRAQASIQRLRQRLTLADFAAEQDAVALTQSFVFGNESVPVHKARAETAQKLAAFYRTADKTLPDSERDLFESLSNLARWQSALVEYGKMGQSKKDSFDSIGFGEHEPRLPYQLSLKMGPETENLQAIVEKIQAGQAAGRSSLWSGAKVLLALAVGGALGVYLLEPALARSLTTKALGALTRLPTQAIQTAKKVLP